MFPIIKKTVSALFISTLLTSAPAFADIIISGTRIIYNADKKDVNVRLENKGNRPLLIQNWLDTGDDNADPSQIKFRLLLRRLYLALNLNVGKR